MSKMAITKIQSITTNDKIATIDIEILTGRTHQIRYHLLQAGLPIIGDYLYGKDEHCDMKLTAYKLRFLDCE